MAVNSIGGGPSGLPRERRLTRRRDFEAVLREGRAWSDTYLVLRARRNTIGRTRFGLAVGKGVGKAVVRNRLKRRLREVLRTSPVPEGWDILISVKKEAARATLQELKGSVLALLRRAHLLPPVPAPAEEKE